MLITIADGTREVVMDCPNSIELDGVKTSMYAVKFDENSPMWCKDKEYNKYFLGITEQYANDRLRAQGYLFLNDVYDALGIARTKFGQVVGWIYDPNNPDIDNYVDLDIHNERNNNDENVFILDPNVDGCILDKI